MWLGCPKARIRLQAEIGGEVRALNIGFLVDFLVKSLLDDWRSLIHPLVKFCIFQDAPLQHSRVHGPLQTCWAAKPLNCLCRLILPSKSLVAAKALDKSDSMERSLA
jgi:hypothetical protein